MGINAIAAYLNQNGYRKKKRQNNTLDTFASSFIKGVLDNPIYCGKLAFGRRKSEKVAGTRNDYHVVKQDSYMLNDGIHEAIISEEDWNLTKNKREKTSVSYEKIHSLEHEHILSGIVKCPIFGSGMYGNVNRKKRKQWSEDRVNVAVAEVICKLVQNPKFEEKIKCKIGKSIDTEELDKEFENMRKQMKQLVGKKISWQIR